MPLTKAQRRRLQDQGFSRRDLAAIDDELGDADDDDDDEPRGRKRGRDSAAEVTVLSGATADRFLERLGFGSDDEDSDGGGEDSGEASEEAEPETDDDEPEPDAKPATGPRYFRDVKGA